jgi:hypothetical protein
MENLVFGQESKMAIKPNTVEMEKTAEEKVVTSDGINLTLQPRVKVIQRDLATVWPSTAAGAENINRFQDYISLLIEDGWSLREVQFLDHRRAGEGQSEIVYPVIMLLTR